MEAGIEELAQALRCVRDRIGPGDAECVEAESARLFGQRAFGRSRRQKSRLA
jgi:hypothetical protein